MSTFKMVPVNNPSSAAVNIQLAVPSDWKADTSDNSSTTFTVPGVSGVITMTVVELTGSPEDQMNKAIKNNGLAEGERTPLSGGRLWIEAPKGTNRHGRVFAPYPGGVVMASAIIPDPSKMPAIRKVFETLTVAR
jgi:hypothetical protein